MSNDLTPGLIAACLVLVGCRTADETSFPYAEPLVLSVSADPSAVGVSDVNGDGTPDIVASFNDGDIDVLIGDGQGGF